MTNPPADPIGTAIVDVTIALDRLTAALEAEGRELRAAAAWGPPPPRTAITTPRPAARVADPPRARELRRVRATFTATAGRRGGSATEQREHAVLLAVRAGHNQAAIAAAAGVTPSRIGQIVNAALAHA